eukprot:scaffold11649_cov97-Skeletonema_dohrnii-CCMP3373.AAC.3
MKTVSTLRAEASRSRAEAEGAKLKIDFLRKHFGLQHDNDKYFRHLQRELKRLNKETGETYVSRIYTAVYRKFAGLDVGTHEIFGCDVTELLKNAINTLKSSPAGKLIDLLTDLQASCQAEVLLLVLSDPDVARKVLNAAERIRKSGNQPLYAAKKLGRIREKKEGCCMENCPFCKCKALEESSRIKEECMEILLFLLSELNHMGTDGEEIKKLSTHNGQEDGVVLQPFDYNEEHFKVQDPILAIICKAGHRIQTDLMNSKPKPKGWRRVPEDYTFTPSTSGTGVSAKDGLRNAIYGIFQHSSSHHKCVVQGRTAEFWSRFRNCLDSHHVSRGKNIALPCDEVFDEFDTVTVEQKKYIELAAAHQLITGGNIDDIVEGIACEFLLVRSFLCSFHHLWHFLHRYRDDADLKPLFEKYPFVDEKRDNGTTVTRYTGTLNQLLEGLKIEKSEFKAAFNVSGICELERSQKFKDAVDMYNERLKLIRRRKARRAKPQTRCSSDEEGHVEPAPAAAVEPQRSEKDDEEEDLFADTGVGQFELDDLSEGEQLEEADFCRNLPVSHFLELNEQTTKDLIESIEWCEEKGLPLTGIDEEDDEDDEDNHDEADDSGMTKPVYTKFGADGRMLPEPRLVQGRLPRFKSPMLPPDSKRLKSEEE